jgi:hypothetical protein
MNRVLNTNLKLYCIILFTILFSTGCSTKTLDDIIKENKNKKLTPVLPIINKAFNSNLMIDVGKDPIDIKRFHLDGKNLGKSNKVEIMRLSNGKGVFLYNKNITTKKYNINEIKNLLTKKYSKHHYLDNNFKNMALFEYSNANLKEKYKTKKNHIAYYQYKDNVVFILIADCDIKSYSNCNLSEYIEGVIKIEAGLDFNPITYFRNFYFNNAFLDKKRYFKELAKQLREEINSSHANTNTNTGINNTTGSTSKTYVYMYSTGKYKNLSSFDKADIKSKADIKELNKIFEKIGIRDINIYRSNATNSATVINELENYKLQPNDKLIFYFSGHEYASSNGVNDEYIGAWLLPFYDENNVNKRDYISNFKLKNIVKRISRESLIISNSCYSGSIGSSNAVNIKDTITSVLASSDKNKPTLVTNKPVSKFIKDFTNSIRMKLSNKNIKGKTIYEEMKKNGSYDYKIRVLTS